MFILNKTAKQTDCNLKTILPMVGDNIPITQFWPLHFIGDAFKKGEDSKVVGQ